MDIRAGDFNFDLSLASPIGTWTIVDPSLTESYADSFTVIGFTETELNSNIWVSGDYTFTEATGLLTAVPEPGAIALLSGSLALVFCLRRRPRR